MNWLLSAALERNLQTLQMKVVNSNADALRKMLDETADFEDYTNCNAIHLVARLFDGPGFIDLIQYIPEDALNHYILKTNDWEMNGLQSALVYQRYEEGILLLLEKLNPDVLNAALAKQDVFGFNGFMAAIEYQQLPVLEKIFNEETRSTFLESLFTQDQHKKNQFCLVLHKAPEAIVKKVLTWLDDETLERAIRCEDKENWHGLHIAALYQSDEVLQFLGKRLSSKLLSDLATRTNIRGLNYLHFLFANANEMTALAYLEKIDTSALQVGVQQLDGERWTPYALALQKQQTELVAHLTERLNDDQLNRLFNLVTKDNRQCLTLLLEFSDEELLIAILNRLETSTLMKALKGYDNLNITPINACAVRFSSDVLELLLEKADSAIIDQELKIQIKSDMFQGWNLLNLIANGHQSNVLWHIINKASDEALEFALSSVCQNEYANRNTALHQLMSFKDNDAIISLLNRVSDIALNRLMLVRNRFGWTPLHNAVFYSSSEVMLYLIRRLSTTTLDSGLPMFLTHQDVRGTNVLHQLLFNQPFEVIEAICDKTSQNALEQAFLMKIMSGDKMGFNALMVMTYHCNNEVMLYFLQRISRKILAEALLVLDKNGCSALHYAGRFLRAESVMGLSECLTDEQFNAIIAEPGDMIDVRHITPIQIILTSQFPEVGFKLLHRFNRSTMEKAIATKSSFGYSPLSSILSLYDFHTIKLVLDSISDETLTTALKGTHLHYYQMLIGNTQLTNESAPLILNEIQQRTGL